MKEQDKIPEKQLNEVEIGNLPEYDSEHDSGSWENNGGKDWKDAEMLTKDIEELKNKQTEMNSTLEGINSRISSVAQSCPTICNSMGYNMPGLPVHQLPEFTQTHIHWVGDAIQPFHSLSSPSPPAFNFSEHQGLFQRVTSSHQVAKVLEFQLQHQSFQWIFRTDFH